MVKYPNTERMKEIFFKPRQPPIKKQYSEPEEAPKPKQVIEVSPLIVSLDEEREKNIGINKATQFTD